MSILTLSPTFLEGRLLVSLGIDLTIYCDAMSADQFASVVRSYLTVRPQHCARLYMSSESLIWEQERPEHVAAALARARERVERGWTTNFRFWDGSPEDGWFFHCHRSSRLDRWQDLGFVRVVLPADQVGMAAARDLARRFSNQVPLLSGHGGPAFLYDTTRLNTSFNRIYALAKRYWGIDVEYLNSTLRQARRGLKTIAWLTLAGSALSKEIASAKGDFGSEVAVEEGQHATIITMGKNPVLGDQNRPSVELEPYIEVASALRSIVNAPEAEFPGRFAQLEKTRAWSRRFLDPTGWR